MEYARRLLDKNKRNSKAWGAIFYQISHLAEIIFSLNQLRFRVRDYAIFEICNTEMQSIEKTSTVALRKLGKFILWNASPIASINFLEAIHAFELLSHRTLQVASPEPIIFSFFIQDLYALHDEINKISGENEKINCGEYS
ncbi:MAG: hypothetical protein K0S27_1279 [Gammaproteobacteria bacterium]|jgi:hypothetical protein|nr:hypothetical protein [Gammaproteobacteria bacterium]